jgi:hypothetical protein
MSLSAFSDASVQTMALSVLSGNETRAVLDMRIGFGDGFDSGRDGVRWASSVPLIGSRVQGPQGAIDQPDGECSIGWRREGLPPG